MVTSPPPYSPAGIVPSNVAVLEGVVLDVDGQVVRRPGRGAGPWGAAHETRTPSCSRRRSQCSDAGVVLLDHEDRQGLLAPCRPASPRGRGAPGPRDRLGRAGGVALAPVLPQRLGGRLRCSGRLAGRDLGRLAGRDLRRPGAASPVGAGGRSWGGAHGRPVPVLPVPVGPEQDSVRVSPRRPPGYPSTIIAVGRRRDQVDEADFIRPSRPSQVHPVEMRRGSKRGPPGDRQSGPDTTSAILGSFLKCLRPCCLLCLITGVLMMLAGWVQDHIASESEVGDSCPLFPAMSGLSRKAWGIEPPYRGGLDDRWTNWTS